MSSAITVPADPSPYEFEPARTALVCIDFQRDFVEPGGFGETLGNDVSTLRPAIAPTERVLAAARDLGLTVIHTREGHRPDLADLFPAKRDRGAPTLRIGDEGPMGRILVRGSQGHDIIPELYPVAGEVVLDKPGKGAFYATDLETILRARGVTHLDPDRRDHRGVRADHRARGQRPRLRLPGPRRLHRVVLPAVPSGGAADDQRPGRHRRVGRRQRGTARRDQNRRPGMTSTAPARRAEPARLPWWTTGDWNGLFGLGTNVLLNVIVIAGLCLGVVGLADDTVYGRILPALGIALPLGNIWYAVLARRLARREGRADVTALPYGPSVPHMFIVVFVVMLPVQLRTGDPVLAWRPGWPGRSSSA